jgi:hypothetical protein
MTLAHVFNECPTHTHNGDLGFAWHIKHTSKQIYTISRLITELCPSFPPQDIEKQYFSDLSLLQWGNLILFTKNSIKRDSSQRYPIRLSPRTMASLYIHSLLWSSARPEIY